MKITLENIRCYEQPTTFTFPSKGLVLLQGPSGMGKSSILDGIAFALYGVGKNLTTHGTKKCKVTIVYDDWTVTRTKSPNRLVLVDEDDVVYEDDAAQEIINEKYGTNFTITSYVTQLNPKGMDSFFYLGQAERMAFLEKLALGEIDVSSFKKKCKLKIKERKDLLNQKVGQLQAIESEFSDIEKPEKVEFPLTGKFSDVKLRNETKRKERNRRALVKHRKALTTNKEAAMKYSLNEQKSKQLECEIQAVQEQIDEIDDKLVSLKSKCKPIETIERRIEFLRVNKELTSLMNLYTSNQKDFQAMYTIERAQYQDELDKLSEIESVDDNLEHLKALTKSDRRRIELEKQIKTIKVEIEDELDTEDNYSEVISQLMKTECELMEKQAIAKNRTKMHKCPKCTAKLRMNSNGLELADEHIVDDNMSEKEIQRALTEARKEKNEYEDCLRELKSLKIKLAKYEEELSKLIAKYPELSSGCDYEQKYIENRDKLNEQTDRLRRIEVIKNKLENDTFSMTLQAAKRKLDVKKEEIKKLEYMVNKYEEPCDIEHKDDIDKLTDIMTSSKLIHQEYKLTEKQRISLQSNKDSKQRQYDTTKNAEVVDYETMIADMEHKLGELETEEEEFIAREEKIKLFMKYRDSLDNYNKWKTKLEDVKESENNAKLSLTTAEKLLRKINEAESASVVSTIETINHHMRYYLDKFFADPIDVEISSFKNTASGDKKPVISIQVGYKGVQTDIACLSGGERARVEVSICLAINALVGGKLILLDESMSSLDSETVEGITDVLRKDAEEQDKLIITVLHQANQGQFDDVLNLNAE